MLRCIPVLLLLAGCTIVRIESRDHVEVRAYPGLLRIAPDAQASSVVAYRVRGLGLVPTRNGLTLGWAAEDAALMPDTAACRILLFELPADTAAAEEWRQFLAERKDICLAGGQPHESNAP